MTTACGGREMATYVDDYCRIHGIDFSSIVNPDGIDPSGGGLGVEEVSVPDRNYASIYPKGRSPKKYRIGARSKDREAIEAFLQEVNTAPEDSEFYPFDAERFGLIASAFASLKGKTVWGSGKVFYQAEAEITCREAWLYGPDKGIAYATNVAVPAVSALLTNEGQERAPISYLQASGDYVSGSYVEDLSCRITIGISSAEHDREMILCEKMLRDDLFEVGWRAKDVLHSYETDFSKLWSVIGGDLHGKIYGGVQTGQTLLLKHGEYLMMPFYGPLPVSGESGAAEIETAIIDQEGSDVAALKCHDGTHYLSATDSGGGALVASATSVLTWETFTALFVGDGKVVLRCYDRIHYVQATNGGGSTMVASSINASIWETFTVVWSDATHFALKCYDGTHYVTATGGGGSTLAATATSVGANETFTVTYPAGSDSGLYPVYAIETDLSDMSIAENNPDLVLGKNVFNVPDVQGAGHVAIGLRAAFFGTATISSFRGQVKRYVSPAKIPWADPGEEFKIRVESTAGTQLKFLEVDYNDRYWY